MSTPPTSSRVVKFDEALHRELDAIGARREEVYRDYRREYLEEERRNDRTPPPDTAADAAGSERGPRARDLIGTSSSDLDVELGIKDERNAALGKHTVGLSFSGGGIRSATFAVGILQGLGRLRLLGRIDYLSTVSGGGYAGGWLAAWLQREGSVLNVEKQLSGMRTSQAKAERGGLLPKGFVADEEPEPIYHLRSYSRFMSPQSGLLSGDTWAALAIYIRNVTINLLMLLPAALAVVILVRLVVWLFGWMRFDGQRPGGLRGAVALFERTGLTRWASASLPNPESWPLGTFEYYLFAIALAAIGLLLFRAGFGTNADAVNYLREQDPQGSCPVDRRRAIVGIIFPLTGMALYLPLALILFHKGFAGVDLGESLVPALRERYPTWLVSVIVNLKNIISVTLLVLFIVKYRKEKWFGEIFLAILFATLLFFSPTQPAIVAILVLLIPWGFLRGYAKDWKHVVFLGIIPAIFAIGLWPVEIFHAGAPPSPAKSGALEWGNLNWSDVFFYAVAIGSVLAAIYYVRAPRLPDDERREEERLKQNRFLVNSFISGAAGGWLFAVSEWALRPLVDFPAVMATLSPPVGLLIVAATSFFHVALGGRAIEEPEREWWGRFAGYMMRVALGWLVVFGTIVYLPALLIFTRYQVGPLLNFGVIAAWIGTTFAGVLAGRSGRTGAVGGGSVSLETIATIAPPVFLIGLFTALSFLAASVLDPPVPPPAVNPSGPAYFVQATPKGSLTPVAIQQGPTAGAPQAMRYLRNIGNGEIGRLVLWMAGLSVLTFSVSFLVDVNLFSLHSMYANRLIRAYLGASRVKPRWQDRWRRGDRTAGGGAPTNSKGPTRRENPVTGFDPGDDLALSDLRIGSTTGGTTYWGPILLVNTSLELVASGELAWADRKSESFVLTPMHCGAKGTGYARVHPDYFSRKNLTLGRAMAISGAAVDPNMNYHQSAALTAFLTIFNARLGYWMENPMAPRARTADAAGRAAEDARKAIDAAREKVDAAWKHVVAADAAYAALATNPAQVAVDLRAAAARFDQVLEAIGTFDAREGNPHETLTTIRRWRSDAEADREAAASRAEVARRESGDAQRALWAARERVEAEVGTGTAVDEPLGRRVAALTAALSRKRAADIGLARAGAAEKRSAAETGLIIRAADLYIRAAEAWITATEGRLAADLQAAKASLTAARSAYAAANPGATAAALVTRRRAAQEELQAAELELAISRGHWTAMSPEYGRLLLSELFAKTDGKGDYVRLSDGGHFENTGVYELIRRRCRYIIACDANADPEASDENLANLVRLVRIDFGIRIVIDTTPLSREGPDEISRSHAVVGRVHYDDIDGGQLPGVLVYIRTSMTGDEPADIQNYSKVNTDFPFTSSANQFFDEAQFESYRALGQHVAHRVFEDAKVEAEQDGEAFWSRPDAESEFRRGNQLLFSAIKRRWSEATPDQDERFAESTKAWSAFQMQLRTDDKLVDLSRQLYPELAQLESIAANPAVAEVHRAELHAVAQMLQMMEDAWIGLELKGNQELPMYRGWFNVFRRWTSTEAFHRHWPTLRSEFSGEFVRFCESHLRLTAPGPDVVRLDPALHRAEIEFLAKEFDLDWGRGPTAGSRRLLEMIRRSIAAGPIVTEENVAGVPAWLIYQGRGGPGRKAVSGIILAWEDADMPPHYQFLVWVRRAHRSMGLGSRCVEEKLAVVREGLRALPSRPSRLIVRYPSERDFGGEAGERARWTSFYSQFDFRPSDLTPIDGKGGLILSKVI